MDLMHQVQTDAGLDAMSWEERRVEKLLRKTGRDIYRLRKTRTTSKGQLDVQAFKEKMAFFTNLKNEVPVPVAISDDDEELDHDDASKSSRSSTLRRDDEGVISTKEREGTTSASPPPPVIGVSTSLSSETVDTLTGDDVEALPSSSGKKGSKHKKKKKKDNSKKHYRDEENRFSYEIDPDIGVIV